MAQEPVCPYSRVLGALQGGRCGELDLPIDVQRLVSESYTAATVFFRIPDTRRVRNSLPFGCGYQPYGSEHSGTPQRPDRVDFFAASARTVEAAESLPSKAARELHCTLMNAFDALEAFAEELLAEASNAGTGARSAQSIRGGLRRWSQIQVSRTVPTPAGDLTHDPHEDGHVLTFAHAKKPGLEILEGGQFLPANPPEGSVLVMAGDILSLLSGGWIPPLHHQVRASFGARRRYSLLFFADLDPALCVPWALGESNAGIDIGQRVLTNAKRFGVEGFPLE